jgi:hypothetical protein
VGWMVLISGDYVRFPVILASVIRLSSVELRPADYDEGEGEESCSRRNFACVWLQSG